MNTTELTEKLETGEVIKMGNHYFYSEDVAKTLLPRIKEIEVEE